MSNTDYIRSEIRRLGDLEKACLRNANDHRRKAGEHRSRRNSPPRPSLALEHTRECERAAAQEDSAADSAEREARRLAQEIRGLESHLR